jgi:ferric-dicitrate binding protein FerR (iron transport regulator)
MSDFAKHTPVNDEAIEAMAASWLVQRDDGFTLAQAAEFARWQKADPRHAAAVAMLEETCGLLESMSLVREKLGSAGVSPASE